MKIRYGMMVDRFSSLDDIPHARRGNAVVVLRALAKVGRFSCFEVDHRLGVALDEIKTRQWATFDPDHNDGYPWTSVSVTDSGRDILRLAHVDHLAKE